MPFLPSPRHNLLKPPLLAMRSTEDLPQRQRKANSVGEMNGDSSSLFLAVETIGSFSYSAMIIWWWQTHPLLNTDHFAVRSPQTQKSPTAKICREGLDASLLWVQRLWGVMAHNFFSAMPKRFSRVLPAFATL